MALSLLTLIKSGNINLALQLPTNPALQFAVDFEGYTASGIQSNLTSRFAGATGTQLTAALFGPTDYVYNKWIGTSGAFATCGFYNGSIIGFAPPFSSGAPSDFRVLQASVQTIGKVQNFGPLTSQIVISPFTTNFVGAGDYNVDTFQAFETKSDTPQIGLLMGEVATGDIYFTAFNVSGFDAPFKAFTPEAGEDETSFANGKQIYYGGLYRLLYMSNIGSNLTFIDYENFGAPAKWRIQFDDASLNALIGGSMLVSNAGEQGFICRFDTGTNFRWVLIEPDHSGYQEIIVTYNNAATQEFCYPTLGGDTGLFIAMDEFSNIYAFGPDFDNDVTYGLNSTFPNYSTNDFEANPQPIKLPCLDGVYPCIPFIKEKK